MSDYTQTISDEAVLQLAEAIEKFADDVNQKLDNQAETVNGILSKQYTVNHEPKIELPFEAEYKYVHDNLNTIYADNGGIDKLVHIFISGYLYNGKTIRVDNEDAKYDNVYINGVKLTENYTCRAEEGGLEKLNVTIVQQFDGELSIDYSDFPLNDFKILVYDNLEKQLHPNIDSFIAGDNIDTLRYVGNMIWTCTENSSLKSLIVTGDIICQTDMYMNCLQELIIPNAVNVPDINTHSLMKPHIRKIDISNCTGEISNLAGVTLKSDISLNGTIIGKEAFENALINDVYIGANTQRIKDNTFYGSSMTKFVGGKNLITLGYSAFQYCEQLTEIVLNNINPCQIAQNTNFSGCRKLLTIKFSYIAMPMYSSTFSETGAIQNLSFIDNSIDGALYFQQLSMLTEQSCLNIVNAVISGKSVQVSLHKIPKNSMTNDWYCKLENGKYVSCESTDEGAMTQLQALIEKGGNLA